MLNLSTHKIDRPLTESPFSAGELKVINASRSWEKITNLSLKVGVTACVLFTGTAFFSVVSSSEIRLVTGLAALTALIASVATIISFLATGFFPHWTSDAHNDCQDLIGRAKDEYQNEAIKLIRLYYQDRPKCQALVGSVDPENLTHRLRLILQNPFQTEAVVARLREAIQFVQKGEPLKDEILLLAQRSYSLDAAV